MKFPILAMLATSPAHGYELKRELEQHFGAALPPLNTGQIYTGSAYRSTVGTGGSLSGAQFDTIELQYLGGGVFLPLSFNSFSGSFQVQ